MGRCKRRFLEENGTQPTRRLWTDDRWDTAATARQRRRDTGVPNGVLKLPNEVTWRLLSLASANVSD